jgi:hypothetical protein
MFNPNQAFLLVQKLKSAPKAFTLGVKAELEKNLFTLISNPLLPTFHFSSSSFPHTLWEPFFLDLKSFVGFVDFYF